MENLGFIGLGNMGHPMAKNLEKAGFPLTVYNRSPAKTQGFAPQTTISKHIVDLLKHSDIIFTMLTNDQAVEAVYQEILSYPIDGKLFVDMSTISQSLSVEVGQKIQLKGGQMIDAPVAGSTQPAAEGTLIIMVGGEQQSFQRARPYLEKMGKLTKYIGVAGQGLGTKISVNYFLSILYEGLAETMLLADKLGVEKQSLLEIINQSASGSGATKVKTPLLLNDDFRPAFALNLMLKDILLANAEWDGLPVGNTTLDTYQKAADKGFGDQDVIGIINHLKQL